MIRTSTLTAITFLLIFLEKVVEFLIIRKLQKVYMRAEAGHNGNTVAPTPPPIPPVRIVDLTKHEAANDSDDDVSYQI